jgi:hypothetical protein
MPNVRLSPIAMRTKGAIFAYIAPRMALDQKVPSLTPLLADVTGKNFETMLPTIGRRVERAVRGKLAQDADIDDIAQMLDALEDTKEEGEDEAESHGGGPDDLANEPFPEAHDGDPELIAKIKEMLAPHCPPEVLAQLDQLGQHEMQPDPAEQMDEDEAWDRRADDARRRRNGADETPEEEAEREDREGVEDFRRRMGRDARPDEATDIRRRAEDSRKRRHARDAKRAADARAHLGRDEEPDEAEDRRMRHRAEDRRRALDAMKKRAEDARKRAEDAHRAGDRKRADDARRAAEDAMTRFRRAAADDPPDFPGKPETGGTMVPMTKAGVDKMIRRAHDEARAELRATQDAERFVRPWVGEFRTDMAFDSAGDVYEQTLKMLGVKYDASWPSEALQALIAAQPRAGQRGQPTYALDSAASSPTFSKRFAFTQNVVTE